MSTNWIISQMANKMNYVDRRPQSFLGDLIRDGAWIERNKDKPFYWLIHKHGTFIFDMTFEDLDTYARGNRTDVLAIYVWKGGSRGVLAAVHTCRNFDPLCMTVDEHGEERNYNECRVCGYPKVVHDLNIDYTGM